MEDLLAAVRAVCAEGRRRGAAGSEGLARVERGLDGLGPRREVVRRGLPVVEACLARAAEAADDPLARGLAEALLARAPRLAWTDSRSEYGGDPRLARFCDGYAVTCLVGPDYPDYPTPYPQDDLLVGFSLQAPNLLYPAHAHPAVELYYVIGGRAAWQQGDGVWRTLGPGAYALHESEEPHAMQTREAPLLTMFAWLGDLRSPVRFLDQPGEARRAGEPGGR